MIGVNLRMVNFDQSVILVKGFLVGEKLLLFSFHIDSDQRLGRRNVCIYPRKPTGQRRISLFGVFHHGFQTTPMLSSQNRSPWILLPLTVALINGIIFCGTLFKLFIVSPNRSHSYLWINRDYPLEMPVDDIPTVEMTFQESSRFGLGDTDSNANWGTLFNTNSFGLGVQHLGPYHFRYVTSAYHSLHCLYTMQRDFDKPDHVDNPSFHFVHCMSYLRQIFMCNADMTLEDGDFMQRNFTTDRIGQTRKCRDWWTVTAWVNQNNKEWFELNGIEID